MSSPEYPRPDPYGRPYPDAWAPAQPGPIPLRPLGVGEVLGTAVTVVRRSAGSLCLAAFVVAALSGGANLLVLSAMGGLKSYAEAGWMEDILRGGSNIPSFVIAAGLTSLLVSTAGGAIVAGLASAAAGDLAQGREGRGAIRQRMVGRWPTLLAVALVFGVLCSAGLILFIVPGVLAYLILLLAAPIAVMERAGVGGALRRSAELTRGHRGRFLGVTLLAGLIAGVIGAVLTTVVSSIFFSNDPSTLFLITQGVGVVVAAFTGAWTGAVVALLYIDVRIRTERLDYALRLAADLDRQRKSGPGGPSGLIPPTPAG